MIPGANTGNWFRPWYEHAIVVFDVETTGLSPENDRIIELGVARFENRRLVAKWGTLLHPGRDVPEEASKIHGITTADVASAPRFQASLPRLLWMTRDAWPCAYNGLFDERFWTSELGRLTGLDLSTVTVPMFNSAFRWIDPVVWVRHKHGIWAGNKLVEACKRKDISIESAHRATDDAEATGKLLFAMAQDNEIPPYTMFELIRRQEALDRVHDNERAEWFAKKGYPYERRYE
jgi:DNA polymerase III epsilon subunit-like protein